MILKKTKDVSIRKQGSQSTASKSLTHLYIKEIPDDVFIEAKKTQNYPNISGSNPLGVGVKPVDNLIYRIPLGDFELMFRDLKIAEKYFLYFISDKKESIEIIYPELFL